MPEPGLITSGEGKSTRDARWEVDVQLRRSLTLHIVGAALFIASVLSIVFLLNRQVEQTRWVNHTYEVKDALTKLRLSVKDVESFSRAYSLAEGSKSDLKEELHNINQQINHISLLTSDNPVQQVNIKILQGIVGKKLQLDIEAAQSGNATDSNQLAQTLGLMREIDLALDSMAHEENRLLRIRQDNVAQVQPLVSGASSFLAIVALIALIYSFRTSRQFLRGQEEKLKLATEAETKQRIISDKLARSNRDLQQFAYVASHDLQEPLRAVGGFLSLIANQHRGKLGPETDRWIEQAIDGAERMRALINDLLSFARIDTRGKKMTMFPSNSAVSKALSNLDILLKESNARVEIAELPKVYGDETQLAQVFQNLIANSIKYRREIRPLISVNCMDAHPYWQFSVADNGIGFDMEHAERIFVIFQRLHTRNEYTGTGIGLALCNKVVERHGGKIWAKSTPGEGSTFYFTLPMKTPGTSEGHDHESN